MKKNSFTGLFILSLFLCPLAVIVLCGSVHAELLGRGMAEIHEKMPNCIMITHHRFSLNSDNVMVKKHSRIVDIDGKSLLLKDLKVPCVVKIRLHQNKNRIDAELISLNVIKYFPHATKKFAKKEPFVRHPE
jgi:hypothetical protein